MMTMATPIDLLAVKRRQQAAWSAGDFGVIGSTLNIVGDHLCEAIDLRSTEKVLDVATGNGNAALAAARRWCEVTGIDFVPVLLEEARARAAGSRLPITFQEGDAEDIPFPDQSFDVVLSTFGVMFSANQQQTAHELVRVCKAGGRIGLANWTPEGFIGQFFRLMGSYIPPVPGVPSPMRWGSEEGLQALFGTSVQSIDIRPRNFVFRYRSAQHWLDTFRTYYGPTFKAFESLDLERRKLLASDIIALLEEHHTGGPGLVVPGEYIEVVMTR